jgi:hypothetical protein
MGVLALGLLFTMMPETRPADARAVDRGGH